MEAVSSILYLLFSILFVPRSGRYHASPSTGLRTAFVVMV